MLRHILSRSIALPNSCANSCVLLKHVQCLITCDTCPNEPESEPESADEALTEVDCNGGNGGAVVDVCGECGGDNSTCADAVCQTLRDPTHGRVRYTHVNDKSNAIHFPSVATYECEDGYTAQFAPRHCQLDGSWSGSEGSCAESFCEMLPPPDNGEVFHSHHRAFHSSVPFTCDDGYKLELLAEIEGSIACGDTVSGSTVGARSVHGEAAGEHIYHFAILDTANTMYFESCQSTLETVLRVTSLDLEHEFVVGENGTASAADCQNSYVEFSNLPSGEYALTIEGEGTAERPVFCIHELLQLSQTLPRRLRPLLRAGEAVPL